MKYTLDFGMWGSVFAVPTQIVDCHLKLCGAAHLKVLLTLLRHSGEGLELTELAALLNFTPADTQDALNYWLQCGVLAARDSGNETVLSPAAAPERVASASAAPVEPARTEPAAPPAPARTTYAPPQRPKPLEIQKMTATDPELKAFLAEAEAALGELVSSSDLSTLVSLYSWAGVPPAVLLTVIGYCKLKCQREDKKKVNLRYIEKVAISWQDKGIDTLEKADHFVKELLESDEQVNAIKAAFGIHDRALSAKETAFVRQWFSEYGFGIALIRLAYERTVDSTGKVSFPYIGKILERWHEKNVKSPEDATRLDEAFSRKKPEKQGSSYNIDEIEERLLRGSPKLN